ncbi:MAG: hypothetical protein NTU76_04780, partial [Candidatus Taylorbacteria bacterium]|nr:hypothetical protein [Candidatus Taylorbacteria bacterium]
KKYAKEEDEVVKHVLVLIALVHSSEVRTTPPFSITVTNVIKIIRAHTSDIQPVTVWTSRLTSRTFIRKFSW